MSNWTVQVCESCYAILEPGREPVTMKPVEGADQPIERCARCCTNLGSIPYRMHPDKQADCDEWEKQRAEHLAWAKSRALDYVAQGDLQQAFASFVSDMRKHDDLAKHSALELMANLFYAGHLSSGAEMRKYIEGFR